MTKVTIDRELLEQVASEFEHDNDRYMLGRELRKILDAPRQPEGEGLTRYGLGIVGGIAAFVSADDGCMVLHDDAQRAIAKLQSKLDDPDYPPKYSRRLIAELRTERDNLRQQLAERDAQIASMRAEVTPFIETHWMPVAHQRDKLADLLADVKADYTNAIYWEDMHAIMKRIDAALAEVSR